MQCKADPMMLLMMVMMVPGTDDTETVNGDRPTVGESGRKERSP